MDNFKNSAIHQNQQGFTLIEVLIAIILLAFISLYTFKMIDNSTDMKDRVTAEDQKTLQGLTAIARIDSDFSQLYSPLFAYSRSTPTNNPGNVYQDDTNKGTFDGKTKNGALIPQFISEDKSSLMFFTTANRRKIADAKEGRFAWVKYSIRRSEKDEKDEDKKNGGEYEIIRQMLTTNLYASTLNWNEIRPQVLMTNVKSLEFSFWDERTKKFVSSPMDLNENRNAIRSLKMDIVWIDENNHEQKITKIYRVLWPYFNPKQDDVATGGAYGDSTPPPGVPNPDDVDGTGAGGSQGGSQGGSGVHF